MKTSIKSLILLLTAIVISSTEALAQKISAAAVIDQHYASQASKYQLMMIALATVYGVYLLLNLRRKRQMNRFMGRI